MNNLEEALEYFEDALRQVYAVKFSEILEKLPKEENDLATRLYFLGDELKKYDW